jgi:hypothetical protein
VLFAPKQGVWGPGNAAPIPLPSSSLKDARTSEIPWKVVEWSKKGSGIQILTEKSSVTSITTSNAAISSR